MSDAAPLAGLHVLELASGVAGPYAGRLLAMLGATVVKVEPEGGDPSRRQWIDDVAPPEVSPLFVHLNAGKRLVTSMPEGALVWAHVVLDDRVRTQVAGGPLDPAVIDGPVVARITAWGFDHDDAGMIQDELAVQAASGLLTATGEPGREPLRFPGWQSQYLAGGYAAAGVLAALGQGSREVEVAWVGAILTAVESGIGSFLHVASGGGERQRALQDGAYPSGAFPCRDGHVIPGTVRQVDWSLQCALYGRPDLEADERFTWGERVKNKAALREEIAPWYDARTKQEIFAAALTSGWAAAMVVTAGDALTDPHLVERRFLSRVTGAVDATVPGRPWRAAGVPEGEPVELETSGASDRWFASAVRETSTPPAPPAMRDVKVLELTWAWAGPFVGRFLGTMGADVARIETGSRPDGWRARVKWKRAGTPVPDGMDPDDHTWDAAALFNTINRNKRSVSVDLTTDGGRDVFARLLDVADALVVNMTASVLADRGIEDVVHRAVDRGLVAVMLPAVGATGPYRAMPGYGSLTEGMGGFSARFGYEDEGARSSTTYYPDAVAGLHASIAVLSGLTRRRSTGEGSFIDLSQQEVLWLQLGEGIAQRSMTGREPGRLGNRDPGSAASVLPPVLTFADGYSDGTFAARGLVERVTHPVTGDRDYLTVPVRIDGRPSLTVRPAPCFDQHTDEVLAEWAGMGPDEIRKLRDVDAIGTRPRARPAPRASISLGRVARGTPGLR